MKIVFITYHNWKTKRHGGFHQFAQYAAEKGHEVVFFSFARPYYIYFKNDERLNRNVLEDLKTGLRFKIGKGQLTNITWPTLGLPGFLRKYFPYKVNEWLMTHSFTNFNKFAEKYLSGSDCFVFESADPVLLAKKIRKKYPLAKLIYRPSDPLWERSNDFFNVKGEREMLETADEVVVVNKEAISGYEKMFPESFNRSNCHIISNGVDLNSYRKSYPKPKELEYSRTACYIGAFEPDYELMIKTAKAIPDVRFIIITPHIIGNELKERIDSVDNLLFIPGIKPEDVPQWITNSTVVLQPFPKSLGYALKTSVSLTAQNYKAMAANKQIIAHQIPKHLSKYGLIITDNENDFIFEIKRTFKNGITPKYDLNLGELDWDIICEKFINICKE